MVKDIAFRIVATLLISTLALLGLHQLLLHNVRKYFVEFGKNEQVFLKDTPNYDLLLLGSSRMLTTVNPKIMDSVLGCNSFNLGQNGASMSEVTANLEAYLATHRAPKCAVVALDLHMLNSKKNFNLYPYYLTSTANPAIAHLFREDGLKIGLYRAAPFLMITEYGDYFKSTLLKNAMGQKDMRPDDYYYKGYKSNTTDSVSPASGNLAPHSIGPLPMTDTGKAAFLRLLKLSAQKGIRLVCIYAPEYRAANYVATKNTDEIMAYYRANLQNAGIPLLEHQFLPLNNDHHLFANVGHLNRIGADMYSRILADTLKSMGFSPAAIK